LPRMSLWMLNSYNFFTCRETTSTLHLVNDCQFGPLCWWPSKSCGSENHCHVPHVASRQRRFNYRISLLQDERLQVLSFRLKGEISSSWKSRFLAIARKTTYIISAIRDASGTYYMILSFCKRFGLNNDHSG